MLLAGSRRAARQVSTQLPNCPTNEYYAPMPTDAPSNSPSPQMRNLPSVDALLNQPAIASLLDPRRP
jgi:hypothetical protein